MLLARLRLIVTDEQRLCFELAQLRIVWSHRPSSSLYNISALLTAYTIITLFQHHRAASLTRHLQYSSTITRINMSTNPPPATAPAAPSTPKKGRPRKTASPKKVPSPKKANVSDPAAGQSSNAAATGSAITTAPNSPSSTSCQKLTPAFKKAALAMKLRGTPVKAIADSLNVNYKTLWNFIDKTIKAKAKIGAADGSAPEDMSEADKKEAAIALKLSGWGTKDIADTLGINYKTLWNFLDKQQKAAGLPPVAHDPDM